MPKLSDEDQCMLDMMEITGFPMEIKHGLYTWERSIGIPQGYISRVGLISTAKLSKVVEVFNVWKEKRNA
jgi:hypothetical protein